MSDCDTTLTGVVVEFVSVSYTFIAIAEILRFRRVLRASRHPCFVARLFFVDDPRNRAMLAQPSSRSSLRPSNRDEWQHREPNSRALERLALEDEVSRGVNTGHEISRVPAPPLCPHLQHIGRAGTLELKDVGGDADREVQEHGPSKLGAQLPTRGRGDPGKPGF